MKSIIVRQETFENNVDIEVRRYGNTKTITTIYIMQQDFLASGCRGP